MYRITAIVKASKYSSLIKDLSPSYNKVVIINLSMGALGAMGSSCNFLSSLLHDLPFDKITQNES